MNASTFTTQRTDYGRVVAVAIFASMLLLNAYRLFGGHVSSVLGAVISTLILAFYGLLVWAYVRRSPSEHTDRKWSSWLVAFLGTAAPFLQPLVSEGPRGGAVGVLAAVVLAVGLVAMIWALRALGTNISMVPQARTVVAHGPYARVRHPLYTAEIINEFGLCLATVGWGPWAIFGALILFQLLRARREEALLADRLPGYAEYQARTPMLVPALGGK